MKLGIYEGSWKGLYWGKDGVIVQSRQRFSKLVAEGKRGDALSALSSTYYSAMGQAVARFRTSPVFAKPLWALRAIWCRRQVRKFSDEFKRKVGIQNMSPGQLDILGRISYVLKRYDEALEVTQEALGRENLTSDTFVLLEMGRGEIFDARGDSRIAADAAYERALNRVDQVKPTTSVRLYRSLAKHHQGRDVTQSRRAAEKALAIAKEHGLEDQVIKIQAIL